MMNSNHLESFRFNSLSGKQDQVALLGTPCSKTEMKHRDLILFNQQYRSSLNWCFHQSSAFAVSYNSIRADQLEDCSVMGKAEMTGTPGSTATGGSGARPAGGGEKGLSARLTFFMV